MLRRAQARSEIIRKTAEALGELVSDDPPKVLVDHNFRHNVEDLAMRLNAQGIDPEQWFAAQMQGSEDDSEGPFANMRASAESSVKVDLALRAVADAEAIEAGDDELDAELQSVADRTGEKLKRVREQFERAGQLSEVRSDIRKRKALDWLTEHVEVVDQDGQPIDRDELTIETEDLSSPSAEVTDDIETETDDMETEVP